LILTNWPGSGQLAKWPELLPSSSGQLANENRSCGQKMRACCSVLEGGDMPRVLKMIFRRDLSTKGIT
jgi:hypothetical protein